MKDVIIVIIVIKDSVHYVNKDINFWTVLIVVNIIKSCKMVRVKIFATLVILIKAIFV